MKDIVIKAATVARILGQDDHAIRAWLAEQLALALKPDMQKAERPSDLPRSAAPAAPRDESDGAAPSPAPPAARTASSAPVAPAPVAAPEADGEGRRVAQLEAEAAARDAELTRRWNANEPVAAIAKACGRSRPWVYTRRKELRLPDRDCDRPPRGPNRGCDYVVLGKPCGGERAPNAVYCAAHLSMVRRERGAG